MIDRIGERLAELDPQALLDAAINLVPDLVAALVILAVFFALYRVSRSPLRAVFRRAGMHEKLVDLLVGSFFRYGLMAFGIVMAASQLGINVAAAVAGLGVAGIAVGFAAQDSLANMISGVTIFLDKPFVVGDWITVEGELGRVADITLRSTRIRTPRNSYVVIPNKTIIDAVLENHSKQGSLRVDVPVGIAYKESPVAARRAILEAVGELDDVLAQPAPDVVVEALGSSSVDLVVRVWIESADQRQRVHFAVVEATKLALDRAGIEIPFPHLQLFVDSVEDRVWEGARQLVAAGRGGSGHG